ncbi:hypothetical protein SprV_0702270500 [Sparganum proliferum]
MVASSLPRSGSLMFMSSQKSLLSTSFLVVKARPAPSRSAPGRPPRKKVYPSSHFLQVSLFEEVTLTEKVAVFTLQRASSQAIRPLRIVYRLIGYKEKNIRGYQSEQCPCLAAGVSITLSSLLHISEDSASLRQLLIELAQWSTDPNSPSAHMSTEC